MPQQGDAADNEMEEDAPEDADVEVGSEEDDNSQTTPREVFFDTFSYLFIEDNGSIKFGGVMFVLCVSV